MQTEWRQIPGFEKYEISNEGIIRHATSKKVKYLATNAKGYKICEFIVKKKKIVRPVHRLVMLAFVGDSDLSVHHINGDKLDNRLTNLEYITRSDHAVLHNHEPKPTNSRPICWSPGSIVKIKQPHPPSVR